MGRRVRYPRWCELLFDPTRHHPFTARAEIIDVRTGEWCPTCFLPSAIVYVTAIINRVKNEPIDMINVAGCPECDWAERR